MTEVKQQEKDKSIIIDPDNCYVLFFLGDLMYEEYQAFSSAFCLAKLFHEQKNIPFNNFYFYINLFPQSGGVLDSFKNFIYYQFLDNFTFKFQINYFLDRLILYPFISNLIDTNDKSIIFAFIQTSNSQLQISNNVFFAQILEEINKLKHEQIFLYNNSFRNNVFKSYFNQIYSYFPSSLLSSLNQTELQFIFLVFSSGLEIDDITSLYKNSDFDPNANVPLKYLSLLTAVDNKGQINYNQDTKITKESLKQKLSVNANASFSNFKLQSLNEIDQLYSFIQSLKIKTYDECSSIGALYETLSNTVNLLSNFLSICLSKSFLKHLLEIIQSSKEIQNDLLKIKDYVTSYYYPKIWVPSFTQLNNINFYSHHDISPDLNDYKPVMINDLNSFAIIGNLSTSCLIQILFISQTLNFNTKVHIFSGPKTNYQFQPVEIQKIKDQGDFLPFFVEVHHFIHIPDSPYTISSIPKKKDIRKQINSLKHITEQITNFFNDSITYFNEHSEQLKYPIELPESETEPSTNDQIVTDFYSNINSIVGFNIRHSYIFVEKYNEIQQFLSYLSAQKSYLNTYQLFLDSFRYTCLSKYPDFTKN